MSKTFGAWKKENNFEGVIECCASCFFGQHYFIGTPIKRACEYVSVQIWEEAYVGVREFSVCDGWLHYELPD